MESNGRLLAVNGHRKRRHRITTLRASLGDGGTEDHESNVLQIKSSEWNRGFRKKRKRSRYETNKNSSQDGDHHRVIQSVDEMVIGVSVPRRIRSVLPKRLNTNWSFRNAGFGGGLSHHRRFLPSEVALGRRVCRQSTPNWGFTENKKSCCPKLKVPEAVGDSSLVQDDEFEVVEALFDLMNQSHSESDWSKKNEIEPVCTSGSHKEAVANRKSVKTSCLPHKSGRNDGLVKKGVGLSVLNDDLIAEDGNDLAWSKDSVMQSENLLPESTVDVSVGKDKSLDKRGEELFNDLKRISSKKRVVAPQDEEFPLHANQNSDKQMDSILLEGNPAADLIATKREVKFQVDSIVKIADEVVEKEQEKKGEKSYSRQGSSKLEQCASKSSGKSELVEGGEELKQRKALISGHNFALPDSLPSQSFGTGWASGLPYPGFMPPFQIVMPDRNAQPFTAYPVFMQHPPFLPSQCRRKRCLTHQYIAHNILCHQQLIKKLTTLPATAGPASIYTSKAPTPNALISKQNKTDGHKFEGNFLGKTMFSSLGGDKTFVAGDNVNVSSNKQRVFRQAPQQITTANVLGPALAVQLGPPRQPLMVPPTNQNAAALSSNSVKGALGSSSSSLVVSHAHDHINHLSRAIPPYMTIFPNNGNPSPFSNTNT